MLENIWSIVQGAGALVGLVTGIFVARDHVIRERPLMYFVQRPLIEGGRNYAPRLRIENRSAMPIIVSWKIRRRPNEFGISKNNGTRDVAMLFLDDPAINQANIIDGNDGLELHLWNPANLADIANDDYISAQIRWGYAQKRLWPFQRSRRVRMTRSALRVIETDPDDI